MEDKLSSISENESVKEDPDAMVDDPRQDAHPEDAPFEEEDVESQGYAEDFEQDVGTTRGRVDEPQAQEVSQVEPTQENPCTAPITAPEAAAAVAAADAHEDNAQINEAYMILLRTGALASTAKTNRRDGLLNDSLRSMVQKTLSSPQRSVHVPALQRDKGRVRPVTPLVLSRPRPSSSASYSSKDAAMDRVHSSPPSHSGRFALLGSSHLSDPRPASAPGGKFYSPGPGAYSPQPSDLHAASVPSCKVFSPGPGDHSPQEGAQRSNHTRSPTFRFGTSRQRVPLTQGTALETPGPQYEPSIDYTSTRSASPKMRFKFGPRSSTMDAPSNAPMWNPGPGQYSLSADRLGNTVGPGASSPATSFSHAPKYVVPAEHFNSVVHLSEDAARSVNHGVHSPGPAKYSPDLSPTRRSSVAAGFGRKLIYMNPDGPAEVTPGPSALPSAKLDHTGHKLWGDAPRTTFGLGTKDWQPAARLRSSPYVSERHAASANAGIHSPGPCYFPADSPKHVPAPTLASGPADRFWNRAETGRL